METKPSGLDPAKTIIERLGGEQAVAEVTGTAYTAPYRWQYPTERGGTGGRIPSKHIPTLLQFARDKGIPLAADDFFRAPQGGADPASADDDAGRVSNGEAA